MSKFKSDKEYGYSISLLDDRKLTKGHYNLFNFKGANTEVDALKEILDKYINTSSLESICELSDRKIDFSVSFIDSMILILEEKMVITESYLAEMEAQINDINHRLIKPKLTSTETSNKEDSELFKLFTEILLYRRKLKDALSIQKTLKDNLERSRNYNLAMNQRMYTPKSERFKHDKNFFIDKMASQSCTRIDTSVAVRN